MPRITKGAIADALTELANIRTIASESPYGETACYRWHAETANRRIATLMQAGQPLPPWIVSNWGHLKVCGWRGANIK